VNAPRAPPRQRSLGPLAHDHHRARVLQARDEALEELARGVVDPVQVFDDDHDRRRCASVREEPCDRLERVPLLLVGAVRARRGAAAPSSRRRSGLPRRHRPRRRATQVALEHRDERQRTAPPG
jgi:hypothetical protein